MENERDEGMKGAHHVADFRGAAGEEEQDVAASESGELVGSNAGCALALLDGGAALFHDCHGEGVGNGQGRQGEDEKGLHVG